MAGWYRLGAGLHEDQDQLGVGVGQPAVELQRKLLPRHLALEPECVRASLRVCVRVCVRAFTMRACL